jgi:hypothetical protein
MGAMGKLESNERYVVMIQLKGPKTAAEAKVVNDLVKKLKDDLGAEVKISVTGAQGGPVDR